MLIFNFHSKIFLTVLGENHTEVTDAVKADEDEEERESGGATYGETSDRKPPTTATLVNVIGENHANEDNLTKQGSQHPSKNSSSLTTKYIRSLVSVDTDERKTFVETGTEQSAGSKTSIEVLAGNSNRSATEEDCWATAQPAIVKEEDESSDISSDLTKTADGYDDTSSLYESIGGSEDLPDLKVEEDHYEKIRHNDVSITTTATSDDGNWVDVDDIGQVDPPQPVTTSNLISRQQQHHFVR